MTSRTLVTVVIPAYNAERFLRAAVESVLAQVSWAAVEVVVVDDGSTDRTAEIAESLGTAVRCVRQPNAGVAAARNRGIEEASGAYIAFLDADDVWLPHKLERQLEQFRARPELVAVGCGLREVDEALVPLRDISGRTASWADLVCMRGDGGLTSGSRMLLPREALEELGGFDERLSTSADWDLAVRLAKQGPTACVQEPLVLYRKHSGNMHRGINVMEQDMRRLLATALPEDYAPRRLRREAYARLYGILAASYWEARKPLPAARCIATALGFRPAMLGAVLRRTLERAKAFRRVSV